MAPYYAQGEQDRAASSAMDAIVAWQRIRVEGQSMTPTLLPGDLLLVRHRAPVVNGAMVLATFRSRPDLLVIKRAVREQDGGWILISDNPRAGSDSRQYGVADVHARVRWIWRPAAAGQRAAWLRSKVPRRAQVQSPLGL